MKFFKENATATSKTEAILAELLKIDVALVDADGALIAAHADLDIATANLGEAEAGAALGEQTDIAGTRQAVRLAREQLESVEVRRTALDTRKQLRRDELVGLQEPAAAERGQAIKDHVDPLFRELDKHVAALRRVLLKLQAFGSAADWNTMEHLSDAKLRDPRDISRNLLSLGSVTKWIKVLDTEQPSQMPAWSDDVEAAKFFEVIGSQFSVYKQLDKAVRTTLDEHAELERQERWKRDHEAVR